MAVHTHLRRTSVCGVEKAKHELGQVWTAMHNTGLVILASVLCAATARTLAFNPPVHELHPIPHIIHQTWTNTSTPEAQTRRLNSWRAAHPHWEYKCAAPSALPVHLPSMGA